MHVEQYFHHNLHLGFLFFNSASICVKKNIPSDGCFFLSINGYCIYIWRLNIEIPIYIPTRNRVRRNISITNVIPTNISCICFFYRRHYEHGYYGGGGYEHCEERAMKSARWACCASDGDAAGSSCAAGSDCIVERSVGGAKSIGIAGRNNCGAGSTNSAISTGLTPDQSARRKTTHA